MKLHHHLVSEIIAALGDVFLQGYHADKIISRRFKTHPRWGARDRRVFAESVYDLVRSWRWYWHLAGLPHPEGVQKDKLTEESVWKVWTAYWMDRMGEVPPWEECKGINPDKIRQRKQRAVPRAVSASIPDWLDQLGDKEFGEEWQPLISALNTPAEVFLRVNTLKISVKDLQAKLAREEIETVSVPEEPSALKLTRRQNVFSTEAFTEGLFEVQDAASQRIAPFLQVESGMRVVDACAGAGGKTLHLAAMMKNKGKIIALDVHEWKLTELRKRASRNGADNIETRLIEDTKTIKRLAASADRVLLDVPCSGLGVLRRNPDSKWKLSIAEIERLQVLQAEILRSHSRIVKPGGKLVYATCSILPGENERQIASFLAEHGENWVLEEELQLRPGRDGGDGFYAARLLRLPNKTLEEPVKEEAGTEPEV